jgi:hypothetical protein
MKGGKFVNFELSRTVPSTANLCSRLVAIKPYACGTCGPPAVQGTLVSPSHCEENGSQS